MTVRSRTIATLIAVLAVLAALCGAGSAAAAPPRPTIVLVHGAFADHQTSWDGVAALLRADGYRVVVPANPLRGPAHDAAAIERVLAGIGGPVVLVGHSYGGAVITNVHSWNVTRLVYVAAFAPTSGEPIQLTMDPIRFPGSQLIPPVLQLKVVADPTGVGGHNLDGYVAPDAFHRVFAPDVSTATARRMLAHQHSIAALANVEASGPPSWAGLPSWYVISANDRVIPPAAQRFMAARMHAHTTTLAASHASLVSQPSAVRDVIERAAR